MGGFVINSLNGLRPQRLAAGLLTVPLLLYCLAVLNDWLPDLRGWHNYPDGWTWPTYPFPPLQRFILPLGSIVGIWLAVVVAEFLQGKALARRVLTPLFILALVIFGYALQIGLLGLKA